MRAAAVFALIKVPKVRLGVDVAARQSRQQLVVVPDAHAAAHDLADAWHQQVDRLGHAWVGTVALHVEGFDLGGEVGEEDGPVDFVGHFALGGFGAVVGGVSGVRLGGLEEG